MLNTNQCRCFLHSTKRASQRMMNVVAVLAGLLAGVGLVACNGYKDPDRVESLKSPSGINVVEIRRYEPRGTKSGNLRVILRGHGQERDSEFSLHRIKNGKIGWIADDVLLVIADKMQIADFTMVNIVGYDADGGIGGSILVVPCLRSHMDCSGLEAKLLNSALSVELSPYSLDHHFSFWLSPEK